MDPVYIDVEADNFKKLFRGMVEVGQVFKLAIVNNPLRGCND